MLTDIAGKFKSVKFDNDDEGRPSPTVKVRLQSHTDNISRLLRNWYEDGCNVEVSFRAPNDSDIDHEKAATFHGEIKSLKMKQADDGRPEPEFKLDLRPDEFESKQLITLWTDNEAEFRMTVESIQMELDVVMDADDAGLETSDAPDEEQAEAAA